MPMEHWVLSIITVMLREIYTSGPPDAESTVHMHLVPTCKRINAGFCRAGRTPAAASYTRTRIHWTRRELTSDLWLASLSLRTTEFNPHAHVRDRKCGDAPSSSSVRNVFLTTRG